jgi:hypothetical protein
MCNPHSQGNQPPQNVLPHVQMLLSNPTNLVCLHQSLPQPGHVVRMGLVKRDERPAGLVPSPTAGSTSAAAAAAAVAVALLGIAAAAGM